MGRVALLAVVAALATQAGAVRAQERIVSLVNSSGWEASMYQPGIMAHPTVCMVYNAKSGVLLRADARALEMRVYDPRWSLPAHSRGALVAKVGAFVLGEQIWSNTATTVSVLLEETDLVQLLDEMDKASSMTVAVGSALPFSVSLAGSTRATNAFRTCARLPGADAGPGSNPFR